MPHIIVEYPDSSLTAPAVRDLLRTIHDSVADSGLFERSHVRTRAYPFREYTNGTSGKPFIHIQARIKSGRDDEDKSLLSKAILAGVSGLALPVAVMTVEIIDMHRASYGKHSGS